MKLRTFMQLSNEHDPPIRFGFGYRMTLRDLGPKPWSWWIH